MKLPFKINLLFTGIVSCILLGMTFLVFNLSKNNVENDFNKRIKNRAARAAYLYEVLKKDTTDLLKSLDAKSPPVLVNKNVRIYDAQKNLKYEFHDPNVPEIIPAPEWLDKAVEDEEYYTRQGSVEIGVFYFKENTLVMVSAEDISGRTYISDLRKIFVVYLPAAILVTLLAGFLFSRSIVRPIRQTIHDVKLITSQNLSHRLFTGKSKDELAMLNETFNDLLNRLEESFAMEKRFISNASHELSTPLTAISSQIEVALLQERKPEEYRQVLTSVLKDAQSLHQLTRTLLEIAKAGSNGAITLEKLRIDEVLFKAHSDLLQMHRNYKAALEFPELPEDETECLVFGNAHLLTSAFKNIMENGCKYSPDEKVQVKLVLKGTVAELIFSNESQFLPSDEIDKLFEPFYRGANSGNKPGVGLGLTLTRRIIGLHKGELVIHSDINTGTVITVTLPTLKR